jgi:hypothetical protein
MGCDIHPYAEVRRNGRWERAPVKVPNDRNYTAFGKLANVRNGSGFAGCDMGDAVRPIAEPRGLPTDTTIADTHDKEYEDPGYTWLGDHSHSWLMLSELLAVDYNAMVTLRGMVSAAEAARFREYRRPPRDYCGWTNQAGYEQIEWQEPLMQAAPLLPKIIASICHLGKPEDVRLVFGFDS